MQISRARACNVHEFWAAQGSVVDEPKALMIYPDAVESGAVTCVYRLYNCAKVFGMLAMMRAGGVLSGINRSRGGNSELRF
ncbi:hypothetical protein PP1Y_AT17776 [Novosphingobium sp. PP1Y]|nr:hypothetical protein PP1Y_AT17776 [Novosphingobium sp. PP1Y]